MKLPIPLLRITNGRWRGVRVLAPADISNGQPVESLDSPAKVDIRRTALFSRTGPRIVDSHATQTIPVLQNIGADAVGVWEFCARIGPHTAINSRRIAEPKTKRVEMMN